MAITSLLIKHLIYLGKKIWGWKLKDGFGTMPESQLRVVRNFGGKLWQVCVWVCWGPSHTGHSGQWWPLESPSVGMAPGDRDSRLCEYLYTHVVTHTHRSPVSVTKNTHNPLGVPSAVDRPVCMHAPYVVCVRWSLHSPDWVSWRSSWRRRLMVMIQHWKMFLTLSVSLMSSLCFVLSPLSLFTPTAKDPYQYLS